MKNLFRNFTWTKFFAFAIVFTVVSVLIEWALGNFKDPKLTTSTIVLSYLFKAIFFGILMSLILTDKKSNNYKKEDENEN